MPRGIATCQMSAIEGPARQLGESCRQEDEEQAGDCDQPHRADEQGTHAGVAARREHRCVAGEDDDQDQRGSGADGVDRDEEGDLAVGLGPEHAAGDRVIHESADAGDQPAEEKDQVLADKPVSQQLGQPLARSQSLHVRKSVVARPLTG